jgi:hypothetical protein
MTYIWSTAAHGYNVDIVAMTLQKQLIGYITPFISEVKSVFPLAGATGDRVLLYIYIR